MANRLSLRRRNLVALLGIALLGIAAATAAAWMMPSTAAPVDLDLPDLLDGHTVSLAQLRGQVIVVVFAHTPSPACDRLLESLRVAASTSGARVVVVVENNDAESALTYARQLGHPFLIVHDAEHRAIALFQAQGVPAVYVFDRDGSLHHRYSTPPIDISAVERDLTQLEGR